MFCLSIHTYICILKYVLLVLLLLFSCQLMSDSSATSGTIASQAPLSMEFSRQESWGGLPFPSPRDLPKPGIKPSFLAFAGGFFTTETPGKPSLGDI